MISPTQQVNRPGAKVGLASPRAASLPWGAAQRRMETYLVGLVLHGQLWTRCALLPVLSGNSFMSCSVLTVGGPTADLKRVSDLQRAAFTVPLGVFVCVKIIKLNVQRSRLSTIILSVWICEQAGLKTSFETEFRATAIRLLRHRVSAF